MGLWGSAGLGAAPISLLMGTGRERSGRSGPGAAGTEPGPGLSCRKIQNAVLLRGIWGEKGGKKAVKCASCTGIGVSSVATASSGVGGWRAGSDPTAPGTGQDGFRTAWREKKGAGGEVWGGCPAGGTFLEGLGREEARQTAAQHLAAARSPPPLPGPQTRGPSQRSASCHPLPASPRPDVPPRCPPGGHPRVPPFPPGRAQHLLPARSRFSQAPVAPQRPGERRPRHLWHPHPPPGWMRAGSSWPSATRKIHPKRGLPPPPGTVAPVTDKGFGHRPTPEPPGVGGAPRTPPDPPAAPQIPLGAPAGWLQTPLPGELARKGLAPGNKNRLPP